MFDDWEAAPNAYIRLDVDTMLHPIFYKKVCINDLYFTHLFFLVGHLKLANLNEGTTNWYYCVSPK